MKKTMLIVFSVVLLLLIGCSQSKDDSAVEKSFVDIINKDRWCSAQYENLFMNGHYTNITNLRNNKTVNECCCAGELEFVCVCIGEPGDINSKLMVNK